MIFDFQKNGALLAAGIAIGAAGSMALGGLVKDIWRVTPFSAESKLEKTRDQLADMTGNWRAEKAAREARDVAIADRDKRLLAVGQEAAVDQSAAAERWGQQCQAAYRSGVAFGRALSKPTPSTGAFHAPAAPASAAGRPPAGGVQPSFRDSWAAGRFDPARPAAAGGVSGTGGRRADP